MADFERACRMDLGVVKLQQMEETINRLSEALFSNKEGTNNNNSSRDGYSRVNREDNREEPEGNRQFFSSKMARLEFPKYSGDGPTEWFNLVDQFFEFQGTIETKMYL